MDAIISFLIDYGYGGMLVAAFLAGSILPFSSEAVMVGLIAAGLNPMTLVAYGTIGNVMGGMFNYFMGRLGRMEWIEKYLHVKPEEIARVRKFMAGRGAWMGILSVVPVFGDVITIVLGLTRANLLISFVSITLSKLIRYLLLGYSAGLIF